MSDPTDTKPKEAAAAPAASAPKGAGKAAMIIGLILPALLAAGASFGAVRAGSGHAPQAHAEAPAAHAEEKPPGPTLPLEPFLVSIVDSNKKAHPMKLSVAVEFAPTPHEDTLKAFVPRIRDAILAHMRTIPYEQAVDAQNSDTLRDELLENIKKAGASGAERVLITDLVSQ